MVFECCYIIYVGQSKLSRCVNENVGLLDRVYLKVFFLNIIVIIFSYIIDDFCLVVVKVITIFVTIVTFDMIKEKFN